ncbi:MAG: aminodeoxychorismate synthase component I [Candidatus Hydrogenedentes bacterium]|nr:aminodeoxychorismate synthase component I [Candidatus Hydrogenedentota bacterium]
MTPTPPSGRCLFPDGDSMRVYRNPRETIAARRVEDVVPALRAVEDRVNLGLHAAGYVAYEAAPAFDAALRAHPPGAMPLVWFGLFDPPEVQPCPPPAEDPCPPFEWTRGMNREEYLGRLARIREHIAAGDTYQVNFTFPLEANFQGSPEAWFWERIAAQEARYGALLELDEHTVLSFSPELFFAIDGNRITARPMKGTRPRGLSSTEDRALADDLARSPKDRAENLMIVDMIRNDLGRICAVNSIDASRLFEVERYPTVWQMTSTVNGDTAAGITDIFGALFPSASVTGAPKVETMKIIRELESGPRGVYCGAVGWWAPGRQARFNVAIRTAVLARRTGIARYHAGSGITWDSDPGAEYEECEQKAAVLRHVRPPFELLATLRLDAGGYLLLGHHLDRLAASATYFGYPVTREAAREALEAYASGVEAVPAKVRLTADRRGAFHITHEPLPPPRAWTSGLALAPIDARQPWTHHKTTCRAVYDAARATRPDCESVFLWDSAGRLTEAVYANIVLQLDGRRYTPPQSAGLLPGVYRRHLLESGEIEERDLFLDDLARAEAIFNINSVRGWVPITWIDHPEAPRSVQDIRQHP